MKTTITLSFKIKDHLGFLAALLFLIGFSFSGSAQNETLSSKTTSKVKSENWKLLLSNEYVDVSYKYAECEFATDGNFLMRMYIYK